MLVTPNSSSQCTLLISKFLCILDLNILEKYCKSHFFIYKHKHQGVKKPVVFRQISPYVSIIQLFRILIGKLQNLLTKPLR